MALFIKLKRILLQKYDKRFVLYTLISCILVYLIITSLFVQQQVEIPTDSSVNQLISKKKRIDWNIVTGTDKELIDDNLLADFLNRGEELPDAAKSSQIPIENLPCNPASVSENYINLNNISCIPHRSSKSACEFASKLYWRDKKLKTCGANIKTVHICKFIESHNGGQANFIYECSFKDCEKYNKNKVIVWKFDSDSQTLVKHYTYTSARTLERELPVISKQSSQSTYNFLFLECVEGITEEESYDATTQLLILPPVFQSSKKQIVKRNNDLGININLILLDSAARSHFYRSLPSTIKAFTNINEKKESEAEVLDFQLFQSLEGHTAENLHALFTGTLFPKNFTGTDREKSSVGVGKMFEQYHRQGYHTFYQDDLCYDEWWGIRLDLGSSSTWQEFTDSLKGNYIGHTGLTFSSCRILKANNVTNPFNGPDGPLCFNGKFQDSYLLDFTHIYHDYASKKKVKMISLTGLNVAHDNTGRRIQSIDFQLADYVKKMSKSSNTLTILFADHGNTYTHYTHAIMEGRFEQYHPALFFIIPSEVKKMLGKNIMNNLRGNQRKLCTLLDIHEALMTIPTKPLPRGIFSSIKPTRNCDDLKLRLPNLCVCEGWDAETLNDTAQVGVLDFAVGTLNNKILSFQEELRTNKQIPRCMRLIPTSFTNVRERNNKGSLITSLDFTTDAGEGASQSHDVFHVQIQSSINPEDESRDMKLLSFDRLSIYGPYRKCKDKGIDTKLCVCNIKPKNEFTSLHDLVLHNIMKRAELMTTDISIKHTNHINKCLYYKIISYPDTTENEQEESIFSSSYEVANLCDYKLNVSLAVLLDNMKSTLSKPITREILPFSVTYIASMIRTVPYWSSKVESDKFDIVPFQPPYDNP